jgi:hypothetical protein
MLWDARARSPQSQLLSTKAHAAGVKPRIDEHAAILDALSFPQPRRRAPSHAEPSNSRHRVASGGDGDPRAGTARARVEEHRKRFFAAV